MEDLKVINNSEKGQSEIQLNTFQTNADLPPPYTEIDTTPTPVPPEIVLTPPRSSQITVPQTTLIPQVLKKTPVYINCPNCHKRTFTTVLYTNTQKTHMAVGFICGLTIWCMLCCLSVIPYITPIFKNADHYCPHCNYFIGTC